MSEVHILIIKAKNNLPIVERSNAAADILLEHLRNIWNCWTAYTIKPGLGQFTLNKPQSGLWKAQTDPNQVMQV